MIDPRYPWQDFASVDLDATYLSGMSVDVSTRAGLDAYLGGRRTASGAQVLVGGYLEQRSIYDRSMHFAEEADRRNIHLGIDIWAAAGTSVLAVLGGRVHSLANNEGLGNYGPTIVLEHIQGNSRIYSLYGHLSVSSLAYVSIGQHVSRGQQIGWLGDPSVNGDYPPHLHLQMIKDIGDWLGDFPGVSSAKDLEYFMKCCPDPWPFIILEDDKAPATRA